MLPLPAPSFLSSDLCPHLTTCSDDYALVIVTVARDFLSKRSEKIALVPESCRLETPENSRFSKEYFELLETNKQKRNKC